MSSLAVPFVVATVFTLGGYAIVRIKKHADIVGAVLGCTFAVCAMLAVLALLVRVADDGSRAPAGRPRVAQAGGPTLVAAPMY